MAKVVRKGVHLMANSIQTRAKKTQAGLSAAFACLEPFCKKHEADLGSFACFSKSFDSIWPKNLDATAFASIKSLESIWPDHKRFDLILKSLSVDRLDPLLATLDKSKKVFQQMHDMFAVFSKTSLPLIDVRAIDKNFDNLRKDSINEILPKVSEIAGVVSDINFESLFLPEQAKLLRTSIKEIQDSLSVVSGRSDQSQAKFESSRTSFFSQINKFLLDWSHLITALSFLISVIALFNPPGTTIVFQPVVTLNTVLNNEVKILCQNNQIFPVVVDTSVKAKRGKGRKTVYKLTPGSLVKIVKASGRWCQITYLNSACKELLGWCLKKNLEQ